jgi:glutamine synthetase type III
MSRSCSTVLAVINAPLQESQDQLSDTLESTLPESLNTCQNREALLEQVVNDETAKFPYEGSDNYTPRAFVHLLAEETFQVTCVCAWVLGWHSWLC